MSSNRWLTGVDPNATWTRYGEGNSAVVYQIADNLSFAGAGKPPNLYGSAQEGIEALLRDFPRITKIEVIPLSMTPTDSLRVSLPAQASALLTQIAGRMFDHLVSADQAMQLTTEAFEAWRLIREYAHLYGNHGLVILEIDEEQRLLDALVLAHKLFHKYEIGTVFPSRCGCELALKMQAVAPLIIRAGLEGW